MVQPMAGFHCGTAELDAATALDEDDPEDLSLRYAALRERLPPPDHRRVHEIARACLGTKAVAC